LALLPVGVLAGAAAQDVRPTFRSAADAVRVDVSVQRDGRPVTSLSAADFEIFDNEISQQISDLSYGRLPIDVTVLLDVSASVTGQLLKDLRRAVEQLEGRLRDGDRLKLVTFNMRVSRILDFVPRGRGTSTAFDELPAGGSTSLYDTLAVALTSAAAADRRQLILTFSDGRDTSSVTDAGTVVEVARRTTPTLAFVTRPQSGPPRMIDQSPASGRLPTASSAGGSADPATGVIKEVKTPTSALLSPSIPQIYRELAVETGGTVVPLTDVGGAALAGTFSRILDDFRSSYVLYFTPRGVDRKGFHALRVGVRRPERLEVRARRGYVQ
jgi:VWFA-related protein